MPAYKPITTGWPDKIMTRITTRTGKRISRKKVMKAAQSEALEKQAAAILKAISGNQCLPSRYELKRMVNAGEWVTLGVLFHFTPVYLDGPAGSKVIDWRCVPKRLYELLQCKEVELQMQVLRRQLDIPTRRSFAPNLKKQPSKPAASAPTRERLYCEQNGQCHYCGNQTLFSYWTIDHKQPVSRGGKYQGNVVGCCSACNTAKGPLNYDEFMATDYMGGSVPLKEEIRRVSKELNGSYVPTINPSPTPD